MIQNVQRSNSVRNVIVRVNIVKTQALQMYQCINTLGPRDDDEKI